MARRTTGPLGRDGTHARRRDRLFTRTFRPAHPASGRAGRGRLRFRNCHRRPTTPTTLMHPCTTRRGRPPNLSPRTSNPGRTKEFARPLHLRFHQNQRASRSHRDRMPVAKERRSRIGRVAIPARRGRGGTGPGRAPRPGRASRGRPGMPRYRAGPSPASVLTELPSGPRGSNPNANAGDPSGLQYGGSGRSPSGVRRPGQGILPSSGQRGRHPAPPNRFGVAVLLGGRRGPKRDDELVEGLRPLRRGRLLVRPRPGSEPLFCHAILPNGRRVALDLARSKGPPPAFAGHASSAHNVTASTTRGGGGRTEA